MMIRTGLGLLAALTVATAAIADVTVHYTVDAGGNNTNPLNGLSARATFSVAGTGLKILLENTSTGVPSGFGASDSLLVSVGFNLPSIQIASGDSATIGTGSIGLGDWAGRTAGDSVAEEWLWTNDFGGDLMEIHAQVISTSNGQGGGTTTGFAGESGSVDGPFGGIAADPPIVSIPANQPAVSDSILFELTLTGTLTEAELQTVADASIVEYGSDQRYLRTPEPTALALLVAGAALAARGRRLRRAA